MTKSISKPKGSGLDGSEFARRIHNYRKRQGDAMLDESLATNEETSFMPARFVKRPARAEMTWTAAVASMTSDISEESRQSLLYDLSVQLTMERLQI